MKNWIYIFIISLLFSTTIFAQKEAPKRPSKDSIKVFEVSLSDIDYTVEHSGSRIFADTLSRYIHAFEPNERYYRFFSMNGNPGLAAKSMIFNPSYGKGFCFGNNSFASYQSNIEFPSMLYSLKPFTELFYSMGLKREQYFDVNHFHGIKNTVFLGVQYRILSAPGRESFRQKSNNHALFTYAYYQTKNKRYGVYAQYRYTRIQNQENGGLVNDSVYIAYRKGDRSATPTYYLEQADNLVRQNEVVLKQYVAFGKLKPRDTIADTLPSLINAKPRLIHTFSFVSYKDRFSNKNNNTGYFPVIPLDTISIADSNTYHHFENELCWTNSEINAESAARKFRYWISLTHSYTQLFQDNVPYYISNLVPAAKVKYALGKNMDLIFGGTYHLLQDRKNDFALSASWKHKVKVREKDFGRYEFNFDYVWRQSDWLLRRYHSTYFTWDHNWEKEKVLQLNFQYDYKNLSLGVNYYNLFNHVYMGEANRPVQYVNGYINVAHVYARYKLVLKKFEIDNHVIFQYADKDNLLRMPGLIARQSYVFSTPMFKKALFAQIGVDLNYNTAFYADAYQPALRLYYLQNERKVGNYVYVDAFVNLKIKRFRVFFLLSNVLSGIIGYDSFSVPHYPMQDRTFKFGVDWIFHD